MICMVDVVVRWMIAGYEVGGMGGCADERTSVPDARLEVCRSSVAALKMC